MLLKSLASRSLCGHGGVCTWKAMTTAEFSLAPFLPGVLNRGAAPCCSLPTRFSYSWDANGGCALHLFCTASLSELLVLGKHIAVHAHMVPSCTMSVEHLVATSGCER